jgi:hypothetical protein
MGLVLFFTSTLVASLVRAARARAALYTLLRAGALFPLGYLDAPPRHRAASAARSRRTPAAGMLQLELPRFHGVPLATQRHLRPQRQRVRLLPLQRRSRRRRILPLRRRRPLGDRDESGGYGFTVAPCRVGAADRIRTGDVQLGKLAFCH